MLLWVFWLLFEKTLKVTWVGRERVSERTWGKEEYSTNTFIFKIALNNENYKDPGQYSPQVPDVGYTSVCYEYIFYYNWLI